MSQLTIVITDKARRFLGLPKEMPLYRKNSDPNNTFFLDMTFSDLKYTYFYLNPTEYDEIYFGWLKVASELERASVEKLESGIVGFLEFQIGIGYVAQYMEDWQEKKTNVVFLLDKNRTDFELVYEEYKKRRFEIENAIIE